MSLVSHLDAARGQFQHDGPAITRVGRAPQQPLIHQRSDNDRDPRLRQVQHLRQLRNTSRMLRHSAQRSGLALTQVSPRELRHQPMQTTHIVHEFQQMHKKLIYYNYVAVKRVVADLTKPMDETDTNEVIVTATNHEHAGRLRTLQLSEVRDRWAPSGAVIGIDRGDEKQAIAVVDHDVRVLARKTVRAKAFRLGEALDWAVEQAWPPSQIPHVPLLPRARTSPVGWGSPARWNAAASADS